MATNRRGTFLINKSFQFRFALYVCSWVIGLSLAYPLMVSTLFDYFLKYLALDTSGFPADQVKETRENFFQFLIFMQIAFVGIIFTISLFLSHRIAGPLYKLQQYFQAVQNGQWAQNLSFRKTDYFQELAVSYNSMMRSISQRLELQQKNLADTKLQIEKTITNHPEMSTSLKQELEALLHR